MDPIVTGDCVKCLLFRGDSRRPECDKIRFRCGDNRGDVERGWQDGSSSVSVAGGFGGGFFVFAGIGMVPRGGDDDRERDREERDEYDLDLDHVSEDREKERDRDLDHDPAIEGE